MSLLPGTVVTVAGIDASVRIDGAAKRIAWGEGASRDVVYLVPWDQSDDFMDGLLGIMKYAGMRKVSSWPIPHTYPGNGNLYCQWAEGKTVGPVRPDAKLIAADSCEVTAHYGAFRWDVLGVNYDMAHGYQPVPWSRDECRGYVQSYPVMKTNLEYEGHASLPVASNFQLRVPHMELRRTLMNVPFLYTQFLTTLVGTLNNDVFWGYPKGTLLLEPWDTGVENMTDGSMVGTVTLSFLWRPIDWNKEPLSNGSGWDFVRTKDTHAYQYDYEDWSDLFNFS